MEPLYYKIIVRELNFCYYKISLLCLKRNFDSYYVMSDVIDIFAYIATFTRFGTPLYYYVLNKVRSYLLIVKKIKQTHKHASNLL